MKISMQEFLSDQGIEYREKGNNVMKQHVAVCCPQCADPSQHLNIKEDGTHALCFHCGVHLFKTVDVVKLLVKEDLSYREIISLAQKYKYYPGEVDVKEHKAEEGEDFKKVKFRSLWDTYFSDATRMFLNHRVYIDYLAHRGLDVSFCIKFGIRWDFCGQRILFPIHHPKTGEVVNFVGRAIYQKTVPRYRNCPTEFAAVPAGECLLGLHTSLGMKKEGAVVIVEGIVDCVKLLRNKIRSVALMKKVMTNEQADLLFEHFNKSTHVMICLDKDASASDRKKLFELLSVHFAKIGILHTTKKDIGEYTNFELIKLRQKLKHFQSV